MIFRDRFPILKEKTYLASHSLGAVPLKTADSLQEYFDLWAKEGIEAWDGPWWNIISEFGDTVGKVIGAPAGTVVPMENVTRGFAAVASALPWGGKRNRIVMTSLEFLTSYPFFQGWTEQVGAEIHVVPSRDGISIDLEDLIQAIDERTLLVATSQVYFRSGALQDLEMVAARAREMGAYSLGDGYQSAGIVPFDVEKAGLDFYVGGSHKWLCGGPGAGYLYVRKELISKLEPRFTGWFGIRDPFSYEPSTRFKPADGIFRFLAGTPSIPSLYAAMEGVRTVLEVGMDRVRSHSLQLTRQLIEGADQRRLEVKTPREDRRRSGMVCIDFPGAETATKELVRRSIILDYRPHCGIRVSPHFYNGPQDIERFFGELDKLGVKG